MTDLAAYEAEERDRLLRATASLYAAPERPAPAPSMQDYLFDLRLLSTVRVKAASPAEARRMIAAAFDCAEASFGVWPCGSPITAEASMDGAADLIEINGESI